MSAGGWMAALQIAGGVIEATAANRAAQKMREETGKEIRRQAAYRNQGFVELGKSLPGQGVESAREKINQQSEQREQKYASANEARFGVGAEGPTTRDRMAIDMAGGNRAKLGAYSDWQLDQMIKRLRLQEKLNKIGVFSEGTASIFPSRLSDAQHSQDELGAFGAFLGSVGGAGSSYAAYAKQSPDVAQGYRAPRNQGYDYSPQGGTIDTTNSSGQSMWS